MLVKCCAVQSAWGWCASCLDRSAQTGRFHCCSDFRAAESCRTTNPAVRPDSVSLKTTLMIQSVWARFVSAACPAVVRRPCSTHADAPRSREVAQVGYGQCVLVSLCLLLCSQRFIDGNDLGSAPCHKQMCLHDCSTCFPPFAAHMVARLQVTPATTCM